MLKKCKVCNVKFNASPSRIKIGKGKYCSKKCFYSDRTGSMKKCVVCGKSFYTFLSKIKLNFGNCCSNKCKGIKMKGENHHLWRGGRYKDSRGYILIYNPNHPFKNCDGYVREHRLVVEKEIGRYLTKNEVVHHENGILDDNKKENLKLFKNQTEHIKYHRNQING